jgi:hypothetical protein
VAADFRHASHVGIQRLDRITGTTVGRNAKRIGTLGREQARRLAQPLGDPAIRPL